MVAPRIPTKPAAKATVHLTEPQNAPPLVEVVQQGRFLGCSRRLPGTDVAWKGKKAVEKGRSHLWQTACRGLGACEDGDKFNANICQVSFLVQQSSVRPTRPSTIRTEAMLTGRVGQYRLNKPAAASGHHQNKDICFLYSPDLSHSEELRRSLSGEEVYCYRISSLEGTSPSFPGLRYFLLYPCFLRKMR